MIKKNEVFKVGRVYTHEEVEAYFDQDTYGDLLDLLKDLINRDYLIEHVRMDIDEYTSCTCAEGHMKI
mgnify:CR=1 FL=1